MFTQNRPNRLRKIAVLLSVTAATALVVGSTTGATAMADGDPEGMAVAEVVDDSARESGVELPADELPADELPARSPQPPPRHLSPPRRPSPLRSSFPLKRPLPSRNRSPTPPSRRWTFS